MVKNPFKGWLYMVIYLKIGYILTLQGINLPPPPCCQPPLRYITIIKTEVLITLVVHVLKHVTLSLTLFQVNRVSWSVTVFTQKAIVRIWPALCPDYIPLSASQHSCIEQSRPDKKYRPMWFSWKLWRMCSCYILPYKIKKEILFHITSENQNLIIQINYSDGL